MLPTLYQFWEIFYKYKSDCVICLPRTLQWFSVSLWHKPDSLLWPLWPPQGLPRLPSPHLPPPSLSILHSAPSTLPPSGWAISSFRIFKWPFNPTEPLPSHQAQQTLILMDNIPIRTDLAQVISLFCYGQLLESSSWFLGCPSEFLSSNPKLTMAVLNFEVWSGSGSPFPNSQDPSCCCCC